MIKVKSVTLNPSAMEADVSLFADTKAEVDTTALTDIVGFPKNYTIAFGSSIMTSEGEMAFMKSTGVWNWV